MKEVDDILGIIKEEEEDNEKEARAIEIVDAIAEILEKSAKRNEDNEGDS